MLLLELGAGYNTSMIIRYPMESLYQKRTDASFIRINLDHVEIQNDSKNRNLSYKGDIAKWITPIEKSLIMSRN